MDVTDVSIAYLTEGQREALSTDQVQSLDATYVRYLGVDSVADLTDTQLGVLSGFTCPPRATDARSALPVA